MRIIVFGADGRVGSALTAYLCDLGHEAIGIRRRECDITRRQMVSEVIRQTQPGLTVNCVANNNVTYCEANPAEAYAINAGSAHNIVLASRHVGAAVLQFSGNIVFSGSARPYPYSFAEYDLPCPNGVFAMTKYSAECITRDLIEAHYIVRTAWLFGNPYKPSLVDRIRCKLTSGDTLNMTTDVWANPTSVHDLVRSVGDLIESNAYGTYHVVNEGAVTPYDLAIAIAETLDLTKQIKEATTASESGPIAIGNTAMSNHLTAAVLGKPLRPWRDALAEYLRTVSMAQCNDT